MKRFFLLCTALAMTAVASAAPSENLSVIADGENVGYVSVEKKGNALDVVYYVDNNGRGAKHKEHLVLGGNGLPTEWTITGTSLMGGQVQESMSWHEGHQKWQSQADQGDVGVAKPSLYVANDASPFELWIYANALLKAPGNELDVLPKGRLKLSKIGPVVLSGKAPKLDAYMLSGIDLTPSIILLDSNKKLFAVLGGPIRKGFEALQPEVSELRHKLVRNELMKLQQQTAHRFESPLRIRNVHVFDPHTKTMSALVAVTVFNGHITTVEPDNGQTPKDVTVIDGEGGSLVAGLKDMHSHPGLWDGPLQIAAGVTTLRDMGNDNKTLPPMIADIDQGRLIGPHIIPSGFIEGRSPYSERTGIVASTEAEALDAIRWYADRGYLQIKSYNSIKPEWVKPMAAEAKRLGLPIVGHVPAFATADQLAEAGYSEITHINQFMLAWLLKPGEDTRTPLRLTAMARAADLDLNSDKVKHTIALMKEHNTGLDTTISIVEQLMMSRAGETPANAAAYIDHMPIGVQRYKRRNYVSFKDDEEKARYTKAFTAALDVIGILYREGVKLWPGTDVNNGFALHRELELYVQAGIPAAEVLKIATLDCDAHMNRDQISGSIERGKLADFFLVPGDPTKDIGTLHKIRMVVKDGVVYYPDEIYRAYGITPFADKPPVVQIAKKDPA